MKKTILGGIAAAAVGVSLALAPVAAADAMDDAFLRTLDSEGISYPNDAYALRAGNHVCTMLDSGMSVTSTMIGVYNASQMNTHEAGFFTGAAIAAFCPEYVDAALAVAGAYA